MPSGTNRLFRDNRRRPALLSDVIRCVTRSPVGLPLIARPRTRAHDADMPTKKKRLCKDCRETRNSDFGRAPMHVVHPVRRVPRLFDVYGHADCPQCGARWHRGPKGLTLVG